MNKNAQDQNLEEEEEEATCLDSGVEYVPAGEVLIGRQRKILQDLDLLINPNFAKR